MQKLAETKIQPTKSDWEMCPRLVHKPFGVYRHANQVRMTHFMSQQYKVGLLRVYIIIIGSFIIIVVGFGVEQLRDNCMDTYWQSDGQLPHLVNIQFQRKTAVNQIYIYTDYKLDESYTPSRISVRSGTHFNDLQEVEIIDLSEPTGK